MPAVIEMGKEYYKYLQETPCGVLSEDGSVVGEGSSADESAVKTLMHTAANGVGGKQAHGAIGAIVSHMKRVGVSFAQRATWIVEDYGHKLVVIVIQTDATNYTSTMRTDGMGSRGKNYCEVVLVGARDARSVR
jgi:hypothetical protein